MPELPPDTWAPVPMRWRLVRVGDVFLDRAGAPWIVSAQVNRDPMVVIEASSGRRTAQRTVPQDETVPVLVPLAERASLVLLREAGIVTSVLDRAG